MAIELKDVTRENFSAVGELAVNENQKTFLASNLYSLAEASFDDTCRPRAIYDDDILVGFLMYAQIKSGHQPEHCDIFRFMIDHRYQGLGYGGQAMQKVLQEIRSKDSVKRITICYLASNTKARDFYAGFDFDEVGEDKASGEMIAEIRLVT